MTPSSRVPLAGVIGWPIAHSRSPRLHGHWLRRHGIAGHYIPMGVEPKDFEAALQALPLLGFKGINVTLPHKEAALKLADKHSDRAALIGAANTLTFREDGTIFADNTDGYGFLENLKAGAPAWRSDAPAVLLGAGGSARAILATLLAAGVPEIRLANRTRSRAEFLADEFGARVRVIDWLSIEAALPSAALLANATSLGMTGQPPLSLSLKKAPKKLTVTDIVYAPLETPLLAEARARKLAAVDGLGMLLHQGRPGFEAWFGAAPQVDDALRAAVLSDDPL
ncbi:MAG: shikimate dehydrogenase [Pseudomonadota bacterium]